MLSMRAMANSVNVPECRTESKIVADKVYIVLPEYNGLIQAGRDYTHEEMWPRTRSTIIEDDQSMVPG